VILGMAGARRDHRVHRARPSITYTVLGGIKAVTWRDVQQMGVHPSLGLPLWRW
jgi:hypothetical protein